MRDEAQVLWDTLQSSDIVVGKQPSSTELATPWYISLMLGLSGWIAALFMLGFIAAGLEFIIDSEAASISAGSVTLIVAFTFFRRSNSVFFQQFGLALSFAGQALILFGLLEAIGWEDSLTWWICAGSQLVIATVMPNFVQRLAAAYFAAYTLSVALTLQGMPYITSVMVTLVVVVIWINEFHWGKQGNLARPIGYGLTLALIQFNGESHFGVSLQQLIHSGETAPILIPLWLAQSLTGIILVGVVGHLLLRAAVAGNSARMLLALLTTAAVAATSLQAPGIATGLIILILGFSRQNRILLGLGIAALLFYISAYYYTLDETLLVKSAVLAATGSMLIMARWVILKWVFPPAETDHA